jgi:threonine synthase
MWPWETTPHSLAHGILDDETYDWLAIVEGMVWSGGWPVVVDEATIARANDLARASTAIDVDHTGTAGLAGLLALADRGELDVTRERVAVIFSGRRR